MREMDERDCQHGLADTQQDEIDRKRLGEPHSVEDYVVEVYAPMPTYLTLESEEDDGEESSVPSMTTDASMALRFEGLKEAHKAALEAAKRYPLNAFKAGVLPQSFEVKALEAGNGLSQKPRPKSPGIGF